MKAVRESRRRHRKMSGGTATVSIHVRDLSQMFNSLDPSPFWDRDLDRNAAQFIEEEFSEKTSAAVWHLHVHAHEGTASAADLQAAVENYYGRLASSEGRTLREHFWMAQLTLCGGVVIFLLSMAIRVVAAAGSGKIPLGLDEGLIILGWLALWRPAEALLYEWVPPYRRRRLFERLAGIRVSVLPDMSATDSPHVQNTNIAR